MYDAVIFDNDGVLLDLTGTDLHRQGARDAFAALGVDDPDDEAIDVLSIGVSHAKLESVAERYGLDPAELFRTRDSVLAELQSAAMRGGQKSPYDDINLLADFECPLGVVSSNQAETVSFAFEFFGIAHHFETVQGRPPTIESLHRKKPAPYYVEQALSAVDAERPLFVGDNESDIEAAHAAGIDAAFIRRPHRVEFDLSVRPDHEVDGLADVLALTQDKPAADD